MTAQVPRGGSAFADFTGSTLNLCNSLEFGNSCASCAMNSGYAYIQSDDNTVHHGPSMYAQDGSGYSINFANGGVLVPADAHLGSYTAWTWQNDCILGGDGKYYQTEKHWKFIVVPAVSPGGRPGPVTPIPKDGNPGDLPICPETGLPGPCPS